MSIPELSSHHLTPSKVMELLGLLRSGYTPLNPSQWRSLATSCLEDADIYDEETRRLDEIQGQCPDPFSYRCITQYQHISDKLKTHAARCHSFCSPIRRIPPEILLIIFESLSPAWQASQNSNAYWDAIHGLQACSQVCWGWHRGVIGTPWLWNEMALDLNHWSEKKTQLLKLALERSADLSLNIKIRALQDVEDGHVLTLLAEHSDRWRKATFTMFPSSFRFIDHARGRMSLLKTLEIRAPPNNPQNADRMRWTSDVFEIAPSLAHIRTSASICPTLQWDSTQLQSLHGNISATEDVPDALTAALALMRHRSEWAFFFPPNRRPRVRLVRRHCSGCISNQKIRSSDEGTRGPPGASFITSHSSIPHDTGAQRSMDQIPRVRFSQLRVAFQPVERPPNSQSQN
ncbi:hypothetical protein B0H14DRAFT_3650515 [Mycena olivaceomarginata]|nr:hypothetical protein B0H14DRAFT_3650515 [Mycena olivaceomarginata]